MWPRFGGSGLRRFGGALIRSETAVRICFLGLRTDDRSRMMTVGPVHLLWPKSSQPAGVFLGLHVGPSKKESVRHVETAAPRAGLMWTLHAQEVYFVLHISTVTNSGQQDGPVPNVARLIQFFLLPSSSGVENLNRKPTLQNLLVAQN